MLLASFADAVCAKPDSNLEFHDNPMVEVHVCQRGGVSELIQKRAKEGANTDMTGREGQWFNFIVYTTGA